MFVCVGIADEAMENGFVLFDDETRVVPVWIVSYTTAGGANAAPPQRERDLRAVINFQAPDMSIAGKAPVLPKTAYERKVLRQQLKSLVYSQQQ